MTDPSDSALELSDLRWGPRRRLEFIDFRLLWDARINRSDICAKFEISPQQASADLATYERLAPENMRYDRVQRAFLRTSTYAPRLIGGLSDRYLLQLQALKAGVLPSTDTWFDRPPAVEVAGVRPRAIDDRVLQSVLDAMRDRHAIRVVYSTMSGKPASERVIAPHALAQATGRWHARCWAEADAEFRDFNLNRIHSVLGTVPTDADPHLDLEWHTEMDLVMRVNPTYSEHKQAAVRSDYAFEGEDLTVTSRLALVFYVYHEYNLETSSELLPEHKRQLVLVNRDEVERARSAAKEMAARAIKSARSRPSA